MKRILSVVLIGLLSGQSSGDVSEDGHAGGGLMVQALSYLALFGVLAGPPASAEQQNILNHGGVIEHGCYVYGERHGYWVIEDDWGEGLREEGSYVNGYKHGHWTIKPGGSYGVWEGMHLFPHGYAEGYYFNGSPSGFWRFYGQDGDRAGGRYVNGLKEGPWTIVDPDGFYAHDVCYSKDQLVECK